MKIIILIFLLLISTKSFSQQFRWDLAAHYTAGMFISGSTYHIIKDKTGKPLARLIGIGLTVGTGCVKKILWNSTISKQDFLYTTYGGISIQFPIGRGNKKATKK